MIFVLAVIFFVVNKPEPVTSLMNRLQYVAILKHFNCREGQGMGGEGRDLRVGGKMGSELYMRWAGENRICILYNIP